MRWFLTSTWQTPVPTKRQPRARLNVSLTAESRAALERFSESSGIAASQLIRSIMHDAIPVIDAMTQALSIAKTAPQEAADLMTEQLLSASAKAAQVRLELDAESKEPKMRRRPSRD